ncbi:MAG: hypothetical protein NW207_09175 [Cytophagales bacterium]|nr:hypothetical protein [Cytophagales bacterium]
MKWIKDNLFNILNLAILLYVIIELNSIRRIAEETNTEAMLNNVKLDYVESDINTSLIHDSNSKKK